MQQIWYYSTNQKLNFAKKQVPVSLQTALFQGLADDEGLFMPSEIPTFPPDFLKNLSNKPYAEVAFQVLRLFTQAEIPDNQLLSICRSAYNFPIPMENLPPAPSEGGGGSLTPDPSPKEREEIPPPPSEGAGGRLEGAGGKLWLARLDQGPTASFKDFAARFMARAMQYFQKPDEKLTILVATSGDTGGAVGEAFKGLAGTQVFILYPIQEVSPIQKKQLDTIGDNVQAIAIDGKFDDCQNFVKQAFGDSDFAALRLSSANSINIGRVLPQVVYYVYMYLQVAENEEEIIFCVPSGNLGNSLGCEVARRMGLPIKKLIIGSNENKAFPVFLQSGDYQKISPSINCISNAMNVGNPSNLARYFELFGGMVDKNGIVHHQPDWATMQKHLAGYYVSDEATRQTMHRYWQQGILLEPHGAVGVKAYEDFIVQNPDYQDFKAIIVETAHPAKFTEMMQEILQVKPEMPQALANMLTRPEKVVYLPNDYGTIKNFILESSNSL
ncbi:MAG: threonine synthase [Microscillaceae bacterium]|jgi:threonine synthase|nr:threonine synthase [Microscillaceae bacterium]